MAINTPRAGNCVACGSCGEDTTVVDVKRHVGGLGLELACGHRNGYCETCAIPVRDGCNEPGEVQAVCPTCIG